MTGSQPAPAGDGSLADTVIASNRGPQAFHLVNGRPVSGVAAGGLAGSLRPLLRGTGATWVACALNEADRMATAGGLLETDGLHVELLDRLLQVAQQGRQHCGDGGNVLESFHPAEQGCFGRCRRHMRLLSRLCAFAFDVRGGSRQVDQPEFVRYSVERLGMPQEEISVG